MNGVPRITAFDGIEHQAFTLEGGKAAAVFVHGFPGSPLEMRPLAEAFHAAGWTSHAVLLPGFGPQINDLLQYTHAHWIQTVTDAVKHLRQTHSPVILVGNSMGGALSIEAASQMSVDGLVLLAPFYRLEHVLWTLLPAIKTIIPTFKPFRMFKPDFSNPEMRAGMMTYMPDADLDDPATQEAIRDFTVPVTLFNHIRTAGKRAFAAAPKVTAPALVIQGTRDELVRAHLTRKLIDRLKGQVTYTEVNGQHDLVVSDRPAWAAVKQAALDFAAKVERKP